MKNLWLKNINLRYDALYKFIVYNFFYLTQKKLFNPMRGKTSKDML